MCIRCELEELLSVLCECETYFECEWHAMIEKEGREAAARAMRDELDNRHYAWAVKQGFVDPVEE